MLPTEVFHAIRPWPPRLAVGAGSKRCQLMASAFEVGLSLAKASFVRANGEQQGARSRVVNDDFPLFPLPGISVGTVMVPSIYCLRHHATNKHFKVQRTQIVAGSRAECVEHSSVSSQWACYVVGMALSQTEDLQMVDCGRFPCRPAIQTGLPQTWRLGVSLESQPPKRRRPPNCLILLV